MRAGPVRSRPNAEHRLAHAMALSELTSAEFVDTLLPRMFATSPTPDARAAFESSMRILHPSGFRAMARASAEHLRPLLPHIDIPTLLVYGDQDVRAPLAIAEQLHAALADATLTVLPGLGHVCNIEDPQVINNTLRAWLQCHR